MVTHVTTSGVDYDRIRERVNQAEQLLEDCCQELEQFPQLHSSTKAFERAKTSVGGALFNLRFRLAQMARKQTAKGGG